MGYLDWKKQAAQALKQPNYPARKLVLMHSGATALLSLALTGVSFLLPKLVSSDGGLGAMGTQSMITAVQTVLPFLGLIFGLFWNVGLQQAALYYAQGRETGPQDLLEGFRRFRPVLTSSLIVGLQVVMRGMIAVYLSGQLLAFTPFAKPLYKAALQQMQDPTLDLYTLLGDSLTGILIAYGILFVLVFAALALPLHYRYRMANYVLLEDPEMGGLRALLMSRLMTFRKRMRLFRLDLQFWWYYALELLIAVLCYGDVILNALGVALPMSADGASWVFLLLSVAAQLVLHWAAKPLLEVAFAQSYGTLLFELDNPAEPETAPPAPKSHPWEY